jgi:hypothetical protein
MMRRALLTTLIALAPRVAWACPVCFGQNDSPLALGINYGILVMIGFIGSLLAGFAAFFVYLARRAHLAEQPDMVPGVATSANAAGSVDSTLSSRTLGRVPHAQGGTV